MPTPVARTGTCARPQFWRSQRSRAHTPPPPPNASPDAHPRMHDIVWSVPYGRCACAKTSGIKVQPRHPSGCLVLNPRDPGRAVWQYPIEATCSLLYDFHSTNREQSMSGERRGQPTWLIDYAKELPLRKVGHLNPLKMKENT